MTNILICTVGGSYQPIISAINEQRPDYVIFICTGKDPGTDKASSISQIDGKGSCIKANNNDEKPTLPNIPTQTGLSPDQYQVCLTLSDDLDRIFLDCNNALDELSERFPNASITADFTGGTKSMSAGLIMAALERPDINLQMVTGSRADLIKVQDGSQFTATANSEQIRYQRLIAPYRQAWIRFAYSEAEAGLRQIKAPNNHQLRGEYTRFRELSRAFAEWDNFNHLAAFNILTNYASEALNPYLITARIICYKEPENSQSGRDTHVAKYSQKREAARLLDLYLNAQRRAAQGRYDDAIARVYRLIEWTAQWLLKTQCNIETANVDQAAIPEGVTLTQNRDGQWQAGLFAAWQLVKHKTSGEGAGFIQREEKNLLNHLKIRNGSILAHGFEPVKACDWQIIQSWLEQQFIPMLLAEAASVGIKELPMQLPCSYHLR